MGIIKRIKSMIASKINRGLEGLEDPIELMDLKISELKDTKKGIEKNYISFKSSKYKVEENIEMLEEKINNIKSEIRKIEDGEKRKESVIRVLDLEKEINYYKPILESNKLSAEKLEEIMKQIDRNIEKIKMKREMLNMRLETAKSMNNMADFKINDNFDMKEIENMIKDVEIDVKSKNDLIEFKEENNINVENETTNNVSNDVIADKLSEILND